MDSSCGPPNVVAIATSEASRPRPITIRPLRGVLLRGSKVHQLVAEPDLHPGGEVHRRRVRRDIHVGQVAEHVPGGDVQRPAERDREMGEVTAYPAAGLVDVDGAGQRGRAAVLEGEVAVHVVADGLHPAVPGRQPAEPGPGLVAEHVRQAVPARQGIDQGVVGEIVGCGFGCILVGLLGGVGHRRGGLVPEARPARRQHRAQARVAVEVGVAADGHVRLGRPLPVLDQNVRRFGRRHLEDHRGGNRGGVGEVASDLNTAGFHTP